jgi:PAS domain S-box-containing protein
MTEFSRDNEGLYARRGAPEAEEQLRLLVDNLQDYAIFSLDTQGRIASWNVGAERVHGYAAHEVIGKHFSVFFPQEELLSGKPWALLETVTKEGHLAEEGWRVRKDGSRFWANVVVTALREAHGSLHGCGIFPKAGARKKGCARAKSASGYSPTDYRTSEGSLESYRRKRPYPPNRGPQTPTPTPT